MSPAILTRLDWVHYDTWLSFQEQHREDSPLVLITRDPASDTRFGPAPWDRALFARVIEALEQAGAVVIGLDIPIEEPSPPGRGGAASDALLIEATTRTGKVVYQLATTLAHNSRNAVEGVEGSGAGRPLHGEWPRLTTEMIENLRRVELEANSLSGVARQAKGVGHRLVIPDQDGVVRRVPLFTALREQAIPAFGLAVAETYLSPGKVSIKPGQAVLLSGARLPQGRIRDLSIPTDRQGHMLLRFLREDKGEGIQRIPFQALWDAIGNRELEQVQRWVAGKVVLILDQDAPLVYSTPVSSETSMDSIQLSLLHTILNEQWTREASPALEILLTLLLSGLAAWVLLSIPGWRGPLAGMGVVSLHVGLTCLALVFGGMVIALFTPLSAIVLSAGGAALWTHISAGGRIRSLEGDIQRAQQDLIGVREALVARESRVESLEEDLEAARQAEHQSTGRADELARSEEVLREQFTEAQLQEESARQRAQDLVREIQGLRAVTLKKEALGDSGQESLRQECEVMGITTRDPKVLSLFKDLRKAARSSLPVLIQGEPGTGKELFARAVHRCSLRASRPFVAVNMAAISPELFESELFGHVKGSFTGALADRKGYFELAHQGTIFLDEIGDLPYEHQGKLLRVLQEKTFYRVGATDSTKVDVRVVAATNKNLPREVSQGWFREDLYFRLKGLVLQLPPLRERHQDLPLLAQRFVLEAASQAGRQELSLSREALALIEAHPWRGNIRELQQCLQQAVALAEGTVITKEDLRLPRREGDEGVRQGTEADTRELLGSDQAVLTCLRIHEFDMQATARALGWDRSTVTQRLKGMGFRALVETRGDQHKAAMDLAGSPELARRVELKLREYYQHLIKTVQPFASVSPAVQACRKRFKNLPDRHFKFVELLIQQHFDRSVRSQHHGDF